MNSYHTRDEGVNMRSAEETSLHFIQANATEAELKGGWLHWKVELLLQLTLEDHALIDMVILY